MTFVERDGTERTIKASVGQDLLTLAHSNEIDLEGKNTNSIYPLKYIAFKGPVRDP